MMRTSCLFILPIALLADLLIPFVLAPFYKGYSHSLQVMSVLGSRNAHLHSLYNIWLVILGLIILKSSTAIYGIVVEHSGIIAVLLMITLIVYAVGGCILSGFFSVGETKSLETLAAKIHGYGSVTGFMTLLLAPLLCSIYEFRIHQPGLAVLSVVCLIFALIFFILFIMADKPEFQDTVIATEGLWQRLTLLFMYIPVSAICIYFLKLH